MVDIIEFFDEIKKRYVIVPVEHMDKSDANETELMNIENELNRCADMTCSISMILGYC